MPSKRSRLDSHCYQIPSYSPSAVAQKCLSVSLSKEELWCWIADSKKVSLDIGNRALESYVCWSLKQTIAVILVCPNAQSPLPKASFIGSAIYVSQWLIARKLDNNLLLLHVAFVSILLLLGKSFASEIVLFQTSDLAALRSSTGKEWRFSMAVPISSFQFIYS